jgi:hypothetical protein
MIIIVARTKWQRETVETVILRTCRKRETVEVTIENTCLRWCCKQSECKKETGNGYQGE